MDMVNGNIVNEEMHHDDLLEAQAHVWNHIYNFISSMSLKRAVELGIPDIIQKHGGPITISQLVALLPINSAKGSNIYRLMRILVYLGFFAHQKLGSNTLEEGYGYVLPNSSRLLLKGDPLSVVPFLNAMLDPVLTEPWHLLCAWFQNDDPTLFSTAHGRTFWDYCGHEPNLNRLFNEGMASDARLVASILVDKCKGVFEGLKSLVDVGGGSRTLAKAIADAFPHIDCTVFDLPHVVDGLQGGVNLKYVGGDMLEAIPAADAVLLKYILHDWNDEECVKILKLCKEAISSRRKREKVIIIDMVVMEMKDQIKGEEKSVETQLFFDMLMMVCVTGRERKEEEWAKLFHAAGFTDYKIIPILGLRSLIEIYP